MTSSKELIERLRAQLPLAMTLPDPITGAPFSVNRDNVLALLVIDVDNLVLESQTVAMLYGEMARVHAAAKLARDQADVDFRKWKAAKSAEARKVLAKDGKDGKEGKGPTKEQVEEYYRSHADYDSEYRKTNRATAIAELISDLKEAFQIKQRALHNLHGVTFGHDRVQSTDDRLREMESQDEARARALMAGSSREMEDILAGKMPAPPMPPAGEEKPSGKHARKPPPTTKKGNES